MAYPFFPMRSNSWLWLALNANQEERGNPKSESSPGMLHKLVSSIVEKLANYLAGRDPGEDAVGHVLGEDVGGGVDELACGKRVDGDAFHSDHGVKC